MEVDVAKQQMSSSRLLTLPHELLLQVAAQLQLCRSGALPNLACVNKRLYDIAKQAMAQNLVVHRCDIMSAINWLLQNRSLIAGVTSVDLSAPRTGHVPWCDDTASGIGFTAETKEMLAKTIAESTHGTVSWQDLEDFSPAEWRHPHVYNGTQPSGWDDTRWHLIDVLLCLCPNVHTITIQMPAEKHQELIPDLDQHNRAYSLPKTNIWATPVAPFAGISLQQMRKKLESLTIAPHDSWVGLVKEEIHVRSETVHFRAYGRDVITLEGFEKLEHLDIPMELLGLPYNTLFQSIGDDIPDTVSVPKGLVSESINNINSVDLAIKILPLTLVWLQVRSCNQYLSHLLDLISSTPSKELRLKKLDLFLDTGARESINRWTLAQPTPANFFFRLASLRRSGIEITFYNEIGDRTINMLNALRLQFAMSNELLALAGNAISEEESVLALTRKQFSDLNERAVASRLSSRLGHQLFMRHALTHFDLLNRPSFDANCWRGAAFFHGVSNTKFDPSLGVKTTAPAVGEYSLPTWPLISTALAGSHSGTSDNIPARPRRRLRGHMYLDEYNFSFTSSALHPSKLSLEKAVSFSAVDFVLRSGLLPDVPKVEDDDETMQVCDTGSDRRTNRKQYPRKARKIENGKPFSPPRGCQGHEACRAPIYWKGSSAIEVPYRAEFQDHRWLNENWKGCLQPHIEHVEEANV